jgi:hypothetical protein
VCMCVSENVCVCIYVCVCVHVQVRVSVCVGLVSERVCHFLTKSSLRTAGSSSIVSRSDNLAPSSTSSDWSSSCNSLFESVVGADSLCVSDFLARFGRRFFVAGADFGTAPSDEPDDDVRTRAWKGWWRPENIGSVSADSG